MTLHEALSNLFSPYLLFFLAGLLVTPFRVKNDFPAAASKSLSIMLLVIIGWETGEKLAITPPQIMMKLGTFSAVGFWANFLFALSAYWFLKRYTKLTKLDAATIAGHYGSDSAGTFKTCVAALVGLKISYAAYMPALLGIMELPGCLVALLLAVQIQRQEHSELGTPSNKKIWHHMMVILREDGLFFLFFPIVASLICHKVGNPVAHQLSGLFETALPAILVFFLFKTGLHAGHYIGDIKKCEPGLIAFSLGAPVVFGFVGITLVHVVSRFIFHEPEFLGTYVIFAVLCAAASYVLVPAVQEKCELFKDASPALPMISSLGLTFTFNVTVGIPIYLMMAKAMIWYFPIA